MSDAFRYHAAGLESPARRADEVAPNDSADLSNFSRALYIGTAGNVRVTTVDGDTVTLTGASGFLPICVKKVFATSTTAAGIVALW